jgi:hypothetical protein
MLSVQDIHDHLAKYTIIPEIGATRIKPMFLKSALTLL